MSIASQPFGLAVLALVLSVSAAGQTSPATNTELPAPLQPSPSFFAPAGAPSAVELLRDFKDADVKFDVRDLMDILRDRKHEGWVLAAYSDPKTRRPLIGAGFSLDLPAREHLQRDSLNPHPFLEPSSAELWQAAGLDPVRLDAILAQFSQRSAAWSQRRARARMIRTLEPQITEAEATALLRISAIQAIYNARAYCRNFDRLSASQQMAMSQLVYQLGVNLEEFGQFLELINSGFPADSSPAESSLRDPATASGYWKSVQQSLMQSQWARLYRTRAAAVIAMLDPAYSDHPVTAEQQIGATLRPAVAHRRRGRAASPRQLASSRITKHASRGHAAHGKKSRGRTKQSA